MRLDRILGPRTILLLLLFFILHGNALVVLLFVIEVDFLSTCTIVALRSHIPITIILKPPLRRHQSVQIVGLCHILVHVVIDFGCGFLL